MKKTYIQRMKKNDGYKWYPQQNQPQPCELRLNSDGKIRITYNSEIGKAISESRWNGRDQAWEFLCPISCTAGNRIMRELRPLLDRVFAGLEISWDGSNRIGRLSEDAHSASDEISARIEDFGYSDADPAYSRECEARDGSVPNKY